MTKATGPTNVLKRKLARNLWQTKRRIWRDVSERLMAPARSAVEVNLYRLSKITKKGDTVIIPGKILAVGELTESITIACYSISKSAVDKVKASGSKLMTIEDLLAKNPTGSGVRIIV
jgi:large subunit ribosomal protein L18e